MLKKYFDDLLYFAGTTCIAVGMFQSPFPFLGWIVIGVSLIIYGWLYGKYQA